MSNLKSLSDAFKEMEKNRKKDHGGATRSKSKELSVSELVVSGTASFGGKADEGGRDSNALHPGALIQEDRVPDYMSNEYARLLAHGVINLNTDLQPVEENQSSLNGKSLANSGGLASPS